MSGPWTITKHESEYHFLIQREGVGPLVVVRPRTALGQTLSQVEPFAISLAAKLDALVTGVVDLRLRISGARVLGVLEKLEAWLTLDKSSTTQLFITKTPAGYEVGFARFGALSMKTSKGVTLIDALVQASTDVEEAIDLDAEPAPDPDEVG